MDDDDESIFYNSLLDRYAARPNDLANMCLSEFAAFYTTGGSDGPDDAVDHLPDVPDDIAGIEYAGAITLKNGLGKMKRRKRQCVIRFHKEKKEEDEKYRCLLMLYFPWQDESVDLKGNFLTYQDHYLKVRNIVLANEAKFSVKAQEIEDAYENLQLNGPPDDAWDVIAPNIGFEQAEQQAEGFVMERELPDENPLENIDVGPPCVESNALDGHSLFSKEVDKSLMSPEQYEEMMQCLNSKQRQFMTFHQDWCTRTVHALQNNQPVPQYTVFLSGPGGLGKVIS